MFEEVTKAEMPEWIKNPAEFDIRDVLKDSMYYPASGYDGHPVEYFLGNVYSFIYVDYSISRENLLEEITNNGFRGYRIILQLPISESQLAPNGWRIRATPDRAEYHQPDHYSDVFEKPFAEWFIFERTEEYGEDHNPSRFSLLFICADGAAAYQALYLENRMAPKILAIIQPGEAFGCNWTDFTNRRQILARSVFYETNPLPEYVINGGIGRSEFYRAPIWPEYSEFVKKFNIGAKYFRIWKRSARGARDRYESGRP
jgi:hypothetical protein